MTAGGDRALAFPIGGDILCGPTYSRFDRIPVGGRQSACGFEMAQGTVKNHVHQIADAERIEYQRLCAALRFAPSERIDPHEVERIAQQAAKGTGRLRAVEDGNNERMIRSDESVMRRDLGTPPVAPAALRADRLRIGCELLRPGHKAVGFAESMHRRRVTAEVGFIAMPGKQRAAAEEAPVTVTPGARKDDFAGRCGENRLEVPPVGEAHRKRIKDGGRDYVVRDQPVFGNTARPARGIEPHQPHKAARRRRKRAGRHPGHADARFPSVVLHQGLKRCIDRGGRSGEQRLAPDRERATLEEGFADLRRNVRPFRKHVDRRAQRRRVILAVGPVLRRQLGQQAVPSAGS